MLDLVAARRPAIVVPFDAGSETEQAIRAEAMERAGLARCLRLSGGDAVTPVGLADRGRLLSRAGSAGAGPGRGWCAQCRGNRQTASGRARLKPAKSVSRHALCEGRGAALRIAGFGLSLY